MIGTTRLETARDIGPALLGEGGVTLANAILGRIDQSTPPRLGIDHRDQPDIRQVDLPGIHHLDSDQFMSMGHRPQGALPVGRSQEIGDDYCHASTASDLADHFDGSTEVADLTVLRSVEQGTEDSARMC